MPRRTITILALLTALAPVASRATWVDAGAHRVRSAYVQGKLSGGYGIAQVVVVEGDSVEATPNSSASHYFYVAGCVVVVRAHLDYGCASLTTSALSMAEIMDGAKLSFTVKSSFYQGKKLRASVTLVASSDPSPYSGYESPTMEDLPDWVHVYGGAGILRLAGVEGTIRSDSVGGGKIIGSPKQATSYSYGKLYTGVGGHVEAWQD